MLSSPAISLIQNHTLEASFPTWEVFQGVLLKRPRTVDRNHATPLGHSSDLQLYFKIALFFTLSEKVLSSKQNAYINKS